MGIGDPDLPTPELVVESLKRALHEPGSSNYSSSPGERFFREAVANWYWERFGVDLDPETEVCSLTGSKEGLASVGRALLDIGDKALFPDPSYPVYSQGATILSDAIPISFPLNSQKGFQPDFDQIRTDDRTWLIFLNYPNNPTGAVADQEKLKEAVEFCSEHQLVLCYDNAYSEVCFDSYRQPSPLQLEGGKERVVEFNSCSKMFNMTGYRVGFAVGNRDVIDGLKKVKSQIDSGIPKFIQKAAAVALENYFENDFSEQLRSNTQIIKKRLEALVHGLRRVGLDVEVPKATFYLWVNVGMDGTEFVKVLLSLGVVATPGEAFGSQGKSYVRFSVTQTTDRVTEAVERIERLSLTDMREASPAMG